ncbi:MAG: hypothetical protein NWF00_00545 [Candidatus Bathyarchaeota archaeon]|nr:hypothetical protein [Candidatus Bathyarchaeota archaeon]
MTEKIETFFEYMMEHPAGLMIVGGMFFAFISIFTASVNVQTTMFLRSLSTWMIIGGVILHVLSMGLRFLVRVFRKLYHAIFSRDDKGN